jgi:hypothetical protein
MAAPTGLSWFETREDALLTMRVRDLILRSKASPHPRVSAKRSSLEERGNAARLEG